MIGLAGACADATNTLTVSGTVEVREVQLAPLASGRVVRLVKDEGDTVRPGDTVAVLEQPGLDATIQQRRAQASAAVARVAEVTAAAADSERASNDLARARPLAERGIVSPQQLDALRATAAAAAARLGAVRAAAAEVRAADAALAATFAIQDELTVVSPAAGVVLTRLADPGEVVAAGAPIVTIGLVQDRWIRAYVGERALARISLGQTVSVQADGYGDRRFAGRLVEIAPRAEFTPRVALTERERADLVFAIKVSVDDDPEGRLKAGMPVTLRLELAS